MQRWGCRSAASGCWGTTGRACNLLACSERCELRLGWSPVACGYWTCFSVMTQTLLHRVKVMNQAAAWRAKKPVWPLLAAWGPVLRSHSPQQSQQPYWHAYWYSVPCHYMAKPYYYGPESGRDDRLFNRPNCFTFQPLRSKTGL
jgi:hypothetical protein